MHLKVAPSYRCPSHRHHSWSGSHQAEAKIMPHLESTHSQTTTTGELIGIQVYIHKHLPTPQLRCFTLIYPSSNTRPPSAPRKPCLQIRFSMCHSSSYLISFLASLWKTKANSDWFAGRLKPPSLTHSPDVSSPKRRFYRPSRAWPRCSRYLDRACRRI